MKIIIACLLAILTCSCHQVNDNSRLMKRRIEINEMMKAQYHSFNGEYEIRGPLTMAQLEEELRTSYEKSSARRKYGVVKSFEDSPSGTDYDQWKSKYREEDELYFFRSDMRSWMEHSGIEGYILVRKNQIIDGMVTKMN